MKQGLSILERLQMRYNKASNHLERAIRAEDTEEIQKYKTEMDALDEEFRKLQERRA